MSEYSEKYEAIRKEYSEASKRFYVIRDTYNESAKTDFDEAALAKGKREYSLAAKKRLHDINELNRTHGKKGEYLGSDADVSLDEYIKDHKTSKEKQVFSERARSFLEVTLVSPSMRKLAELALKHVGLTLEDKAAEFGVLEEARKRKLLPQELTSKEIVEMKPEELKEIIPDETPFEN